MGSDLAFVIATNLALLDDSILEFCGQEDVYISTSLDGPADLHNRNRRRPGQDSWEATVGGIRKVQRALGPDRVSALMTTTEASLDRAHDIIDSYAELGSAACFPAADLALWLRAPRRGGAGYDVERWLTFYEDGSRLHHRPEPARASDGGDLRRDRRQEDVHQR